MPHTGSRKTAKNNNTSGQPIKYCSDRCRNRKPGPIDRKIESTITSLLNGESDSGIEQTGAQSRVVKGDHRLIITMDEVEELVFGSRFDPEKVYGRRKNRKSRVIGAGNAAWKSVDMESASEEEEETSSADEDEGGGAVLLEGKGGAKVRPPQTESEVNFSVGGERGRAEKIEESAVDADKRLEGQKKAEEREMVRRAARRAVVFGLETSWAPKEQKVGKKGKHAKHMDDEEEGPVPTKRKCEAIMQGSVVEPSFAKGNWSIRWRE